MSAGKTICPFEDMVMVAMVFSQSILLYSNYSTTAYHVRNYFDVCLTCVRRILSSQGQGRNSGLPRIAPDVRLNHAAQYASLLRPSYELHFCSFSSKSGRWKRTTLGVRAGNWQTRSASGFATPSLTFCVLPCQCQTRKRYGRDYKSRPAADASMPRRPWSLGSGGPCRMALVMVSWLPPPV